MTVNAKRVKELGIKSERVRELINSIDVQSKDVENMIDDAKLNGKRRF